MRCPWHGVRERKADSLEKGTLARQRKQRRPCRKRRKAWPDASSFPLRAWDAEGRGAADLGMGASP